MKQEKEKLPDISRAVACPSFEVDGIWYHPFYGDLIGELPEIEGRYHRYSRFICKNWQDDEKIIKKLKELGY